MSCAGKGYGSKQYSDDYLTSQFSINANVNPTPTSSRKCRKYKSSYPSFTPTIERISVSSSKINTYTEVHIVGTNFLPNNTTFIQFGNSGYLPITYYSSSTISFLASFPAPGILP